MFGLPQKMLPKNYNKLLAMLLKNWQKTLKFVQLLFANSFKNVLIYCTKAIVFFKLAVFYLCLSYFLQRWQYGWNKTFFLWNSFQYSVVAQLSIGMKCYHLEHKYVNADHAWRSINLTIQWTRKVLTSLYMLTTFFLFMIQLTVMSWTNFLVWGQAA